MEFIRIILVLLFGSAVGSFINVLSARTVAGQSLWMPRSFCDACAKPLWRRDLIPVVSFFLLKARCRFCNIKIAWQYPLVELVTALLFLAAYLKWWQDPGQMVMAWIVITAVIALFLTDIRAMVLPDQISIPAIVVLLGFDMIVLGKDPKTVLWALLIGGGFFFLQYLFSRGKWIGSGDIRFGLLMSAALGDWQRTVIAIFFSYILGALITLPLMFAKRVNLKTAVPLGVFLAVGTLAVLFFGDYLIQWFLNP
ncbi:MAG: prepilin peptidase [bacterium]|nr:prepilin peptidase [bacterium]